MRVNEDYLSTVKAAVVDAIATEPLNSGRAERLRILADVLRLGRSTGYVRMEDGSVRQLVLLDRSEVIAAITGAKR